MGDRLVQILPADGADEAAVLDDEDPALGVALADDHRVGDGLVRADRPRAGRDMTCSAAHRLARSGRKALAKRLLGLGERAAEDRRGRLAVSAAAEARSDRGRVDLGRPAAGDREHALVHLDEQDERAAVGQVDDLVREVRDAVDVPRPGDGRDEHVHARPRARSEPAAISAASSSRSSSVRGVWRNRASRSWRAPWRRHHASASASRWVAVGYVSEPVSSWIPSAKAVASSGGHRDLPLRQDSDERRRQRAVLRDHRVLGLHPVGQLAGVMVEDDRLDLRVARNRPRDRRGGRGRGLDDDQPPDRLRLEPRGLDGVELVRVQAEELAHVAVQRALDRDDGVRIEPASGEQRCERVEIRVRVRGDDLGCLHTRIVA